MRKKVLLELDAQVVADVERRRDFHRATGSKLTRTGAFRVLLYEALGATIFAPPQLQELLTRYRRQYVALLDPTARNDVAQQHLKAWRVGSAGEGAPVVPLPAAADADDPTFGLSPLMLLNLKEAGAMPDNAFEAEAELGLAAANAVDDGVRSDDDLDDDDK